jgi:tetratricopeptide (TPR) repeat protein
VATDLRPLWDFDDLDATEKRFRARLAAEKTAAARAEVLTQLARIEALRGRFRAGDELIREAEALAGSVPAVRVRIGLERGRLLRSSGEPAAALPLFEAAFDAALEAGEDFLAGDAAHMGALAADRAGMAAWTERGLDLADRSTAAGYWAGPLLNNLGWAYFEAGEYEPALDAFRRALAARERHGENPVEIPFARYCVAKALRALGRPAEAVAILEDVAAQAGRGEPDEFFDEELAATREEVARSAG